MTDMYLCHSSAPCVFSFRLHRSLLKAAAVRQTSDVWVSINVDAYLVVTCHFCGLENQSQFSSVGNGDVPPIPHFRQYRVACEGASLMEEWRLTNNMVTDPNTACVRELKLRNFDCTEAACTAPLCLLASRPKHGSYYRSSTTSKTCYSTVLYFPFACFIKTNCVRTALILWPTYPHR